MMALLALGAAVVGVALACLLERRRAGAGQDPKRAYLRLGDAQLPGPATIRAQTDDLLHIRVVAFDAFGTLVQITDRRDLWREIGQRAIRRVDARCEPVTLKEHVVACDEILIVGDSRVSDVEQARRFGIRALHLVRSGGTLSNDSVSSLRDVIRLLTDFTSERP